MTKIQTESVTKHQRKVKQIEMDSSTLSDILTFYFETKKYRNKNEVITTNPIIIAMLWESRERDGGGKLTKLRDRGKVRRPHHQIPTLISHG